MVRFKTILAIMVLVALFSCMSMTAVSQLADYRVVTVTPTAIPENTFGMRGNASEYNIVEWERMTDPSHGIMWNMTQPAQNDVQT